MRKTDRFAQLAVAAATQAVADADLDIAADAARIGCSIGTGIGGLKHAGDGPREALRARAPTV